MKIKINKIRWDITLDNIDKLPYFLSENSAVIIINNIFTNDDILVANIVEALTIAYIRSFGFGGTNTTYTETQLSKFVAANAANILLHVSKVYQTLVLKPRVKTLQKNITAAISKTTPQKPSGSGTTGAA